MAPALEVKFIKIAYLLEMDTSSLLFAYTGVSWVLLAKNTKSQSLMLIPRAASICAHEALKKFVQRMKMQEY